jgi:hypothetical protein
MIIISRTDIIFRKSTSLSFRKDIGIKAITTKDYTAHMIFMDDTNPYFSTIGEKANY